MVRGSGYYEERTLRRRTERNQRQEEDEMSSPYICRTYEEPAPAPRENAMEHTSMHTHFKIRAYYQPFGSPMNTTHDTFPNAPVYYGEQDYGYPKASIAQPFHGTEAPPANSHAPYYNYSNYSSYPNVPQAQWISQVESMMYGLNPGPPAEIAVGPYHKYTELPGNDPEGVPARRKVEYRESSGSQRVPGTRQRAPPCRSQYESEEPSIETLPALNIHVRSAEASGHLDPWQPPPGRVPEPPSHRRKRSETWEGPETWNDSETLNEPEAREGSTYWEGFRILREPGTFDNPIRLLFTDELGRIHEGVDSSQVAVVLLTRDSALLSTVPGQPKRVDSMMWSITEQVSNIDKEYGIALVGIVPSSKLGYPNSLQCREIMRGHLDVTGYNNIIVQTRGHRSLEVRGNKQYVGIHIDAKLVVARSDGPLTPRSWYLQKAGSNNYDL
ncbi:hypothetical protein AJ79_08544 [Helicocarpus griseus UAMH5409]|uniref:Uncharacterized protein n=1 Tax=Helicocarpus griseus UAMH5409 TaxID=1447875 RepID=A0A2B7WS85_9EURO|nr:hypothetical protein AJ79_08544 [Helicocarpus griseus UAMH5409]